MPICTDQNNTLPYSWDGMIYAAENGADIISNSVWNGDDSNAYQEIVNYAQGWAYCRCCAIILTTQFWDTRPVIRTSFQLLR